MQQPIRAAWTMTLDEYTEFLWGAADTRRTAYPLWMGIALLVIAILKATLPWFGRDVISGTLPSGRGNLVQALSNLGQGLAAISPLVLIVAFFALYALGSFFLLRRAQRPPARVYTFANPDRCRRRNRAARVLIGGAFCIVLLSPTFAPAYGESFDWTTTLLFSPIAIGLGAWIALSGLGGVRRAFESQPQLAVETNFQADIDGVSFTNGGGRSEVRWHAIQFAFETQRLIALFSSPEIGHIIVKQYLTASDLDALRAQLHSSLIPGPVGFQLATSGTGDAHRVPPPLPSNR